MKPCRDDDPHCPWHQRARLALRRSLRWRLVLVFLVLALALAVTFIGGVQKALSVGWRAAARPLLVDYVARLAQEVGGPPNIARAQALVQRLPMDRESVVQGLGVALGGRRIGKEKKAQ